MQETITLKIGICRCTQLYHGELSGKEIEIRSQHGRALNHPKRFALEEVQIPAGQTQQIKTLKENGCNFFVDVHGHTVVLRFSWPVRHGPKDKWKLYQTYDETISRGWNPGNGEEPPTSDQLKDDIRDTIEKLTKRDTEDWLFGMRQMAKQLASAAT